MTTDQILKYFKTQKDYDSLVKAGWEFRIDEWENHHNGNPEESLEYRKISEPDSKFESIFARAMTKNEFYDHTIHRKVVEWLEENQYDIEDIIIGKIQKLLSKGKIKNSEDALAFIKKRMK